MPNRYISTCIFFLLSLQCAGKGDSLLTKSRLVRLDLSGSYTTEKSWWNDRQSFVVVKGLAESRWRTTYASGWKRNHYVYSQVGYTIFTDSFTTKSADAFKIQLRWMEKGKRKLTHTYSINMQSQWLNSWYNYGDHQEWRGGFMNPAFLEVGYSFTWEFLSNSNLMLTPATLQVNVQPKKMQLSHLSDSPLLTSRHSHIYSRYGFSGYLTIDESFYKELILLQHQSHLFFNALTAKHIQFDITNRVCIRFFKYLQLRLETSLMYFPDQSLQLQYRQEVLLGIFYEHRK
ncbi:MAG: hypothetical protein IPN36_05535 [Bacteroidetes bacterium]|nr:hypothetical protein [Bacteroidota bacterium]MBL0097458.1 hypothetical protein [Bacteroidota bacterium]